MRLPVAGELDSGLAALLDFVYVLCEDFPLAEVVMMINELLDADFTLFVNIEHSIRNEARNWCKVRRIIC